MCVKRFEDDILEYLKQYHVFPAVTPQEARDLKWRIKMMSDSSEIKGTAREQDGATRPFRGWTKPEKKKESPPPGKLNNNVGEYVLSFDPTLFGEYLTKHNIQVDKKEAIERIQKSYESRRRVLATKYTTSPADFYTYYLKNLDLSFDKAQQLCEGPVFGELIYQITGVKSTTYAEYSFKCALDALEEDDIHLSPYANFGMFVGFDKKKLLWLKGPEGQAAVTELEAYNKKFSKLHIQYQLYSAGLQFETCQNRLWDETQ